SPARRGGEIRRAAGGTPATARPPAADPDG
ncbi:hypothetical protein AZZ98_001363, partial [Serratia marcescens]